MTTTVLFVEHLITGVQAFVWVGLFVLTFFGPANFQLDRLKDYETPLVLLVLAFVYPIGIFVDNLADAILNSWSDKIRDRRMKLENLEGGSLRVMKVLKDADDEYLKAYIGYVRTKIRISRSTALNFALITLASLLFTVVRLSSLLPRPLFFQLLAFELFVGITASILALVSWRSFTETFARQIIRTSRVFSSKSKASDEVAEQKETDPEGGAS